MLIQIPLKLVRTGMTKLLHDALRVTADPAGNGMLGAVFAGLFTAWPGYGVGLVTADLTPPTYGGYARQALTWSPVGTDAAGRQMSQSGGLLWNPTDSSAASTVLGVGIYSAVAAGNLYGVGLFDHAVELATPADELTTVLQVAAPIDPADWGLGVGIR